jgi:hypothetical protein
MTLPHDIARCTGVQYDGHWREGCEHCMRRTSADGYCSIDPPEIIAFECEYLIEPPEGCD